MREMKESGIEWVGMVPSQWSSNKLKRVVSERFGGIWGNEEDIGISNVCLRIADFDFDKGTFRRKDLSEYTLRGYSSVQISKYRLRANDILIEKSGGGEKTPVGRAVLYSKDISAVFANFMECLRVKNSTVLPLFFEYWLRSLYHSRVTPFYIKQTTGIQNLDLTMLLSRELIFFPPIDEQERIANYLDKKCAEIDGLVADIQTEINTLEQYRRSVITESVTKGINPNVERIKSKVKWIGLMPSSWHCIKGKYFLKYVQKPIRSDDNVITCFRDGEVTLRSNRREDGFTMADKEIGYQGIDIGDLVVHGMDGFAGSIGISDSRGKASPVLNVLDTLQNKKYVMYYLRSMAYGNVFMALSTGIRVRSCDLRWNKLADLLYPIPPIEEQEKIVKYIDDKLNKADEMIAVKKKQLDTLDAYKKSLIFEYVTGKKEIV